MVLCIMKYKMQFFPESNYRLMVLLCRISQKNDWIKNSQNIANGSYFGTYVQTHAYQAIYVKKERSMEFFKKWCNISKKDELNLLIR